MPENGSASIASRTNIANPSAPLRKSTGFVATITRTAPVGPITGSPSAPGRWPRSCLRPRRGWPVSSRPQPQLRSSRHWARTCIAAPCAAGEARCRRARIHHRRHKLQFFRVRMPGRGLSQLTAPAKQLLRRQTRAPSHGTDRVTTRHDLCNDPCLVLVAPLPAPTRSSEDFQPSDRLRDSTTHCVHPKPNSQNQTAGSQISTSSGK
ncbi:hypothetical protein ACVWW1_008677 [Bradyrhizobium sp. JR3.5]